MSHEPSSASDLFGSDLPKTMQLISTIIILGCGCANIPFILAAPDSEHAWLSWAALVFCLSLALCNAILLSGRSAR